MTVVVNDCFIIIVKMVDTGAAGQFLDFCNAYFRVSSFFVWIAVGLEREVLGEKRISEFSQRRG
jgi:hypothetical protein